MPFAGGINESEARLLLNKWHQEQTPLYLVLSVGDPPSSLRLHMPARVSALNPHLAITHAGGSAEGALKCFWADIVSFHYREFRDDAERLTAVPGAREFMRYRPILMIGSRHDLLIQLVDLSAPS